MALDTWMTALKGKLAEVSGIVQVHKYDELPGAILVFPSVLITMDQGEFEYSAGGPNRAWHDVVITLFMSEQILPEAHVQAASFIEPIRNKLAANLRLGATVLAILPSPDLPTYEGPGQIEYGDKRHVGVLFHYRVFVEETGQYPVAQ